MYAYTYSQTCATYKIKMIIHTKPMYVHKPQLKKKHTLKHTCIPVVGLYRLLVGSVSQCVPRLNFFSVYICE